MEKESLLQLVAEILEVDAVSETENLENQGWDSLANLSFIAEADMRAGIEINADELADAQTVEDLFALVQRA
ncbi:acyl carrier protein [Leucobacter japonicus]|uniref:acyl carrier protein n=1 Tax=Leucobacter japonicus TaxID=1461259 RepID=UPI0006A7CC8A|nr:acyl carrier protein [Leucobacter japonicus]